jgi:hypothetical protein
MTSVAALGECSCVVVADADMRYHAHNALCSTMQSEDNSEVSEDEGVVHSNEEEQVGYARAIVLPQLLLVGWPIYCHPMTWTWSDVVPHPMPHPSMPHSRFCPRATLPA